MRTLLRSQRYALVSPLLSLDFSSFNSSRFRTGWSRDSSSTESSQDLTETGCIGGPRTISCSVRQDLSSPFVQFSSYSFAPFPTSDPISTVTYTISLYRVQGQFDSRHSTPVISSRELRRTNLGCPSSRFTTSAPSRS